MPTETTDAAASTATTYLLSLDTPYRGSLSSLGDHDWYAVTLNAGTTYSFAMTGNGVGSANVDDTFLTLLNSSGATVATNDDGGPGAYSMITYTPSVGGTYYLDAGAYNNLQTGQYSVSVSQGVKPFFDEAMASAALLVEEFSWSSFGSPSTVTYGFRQSLPSYSDPGGSNISTFTKLTAPQMAAVQSVTRLWADLANVTFVPVNGSSYTDNAAILIGNYSDATDGAGAFAYLPGSTTSTASAGDIWLNTDVSKTSLPQGDYSFLTIMHEMGHALGLSHPGDYNASGGLSITYSADAQFRQDSEQYTIMSYFGADETGSSDGGFADTPMLYDVYAIQQLYGANMSTRTGDTIYGFGSNAGATYDFATNTQPGLCIWDAGGSDLLDCSSYTQDQIISLKAGSFSSIGGLVNNVSIAFGATIENATGGSGNDTITGNDAANVLRGGSGSDTLSGGAGADQLFGDAGDDTIIFSPEDNLASVMGGVGTDTLLISDGVATPYSFGLAAHEFEVAKVETFDHGSESWASNTRYYRDGWVQSQQYVTYDDHSAIRNGYDDAGLLDWLQEYNASAVLVRYTDYDQAAASGNSWSQFYNLYDAASGVQTQKFTTYDDNSSQRQGYDSAGLIDWLQEFDTDGTLVRYTDYDQGGSQTYSSFYNLYDGTSGLQTQKYVEYDTHSSLRQGFDSAGRLDWQQENRADGSLAYYTDWDQAGAGDWSYYVNIYDALGNLLQHRTVYDDGHVVMVIA